MEYKFKLDSEKRKADEEARRQEIIKSTDPSMDEMGTVFIRNMGYGSSTKRMTRREAMLNGHMEEQGPALPWKSDKEAENEKRQQEEERKRKADEETKRRQEIIKSTDPSMDEMGTVFIRNMGYGSSTKRMTRREAMLNGHMEEQGPALPWKSDKEAENEKRQQEEERKRKADEETKRRQEIIKSTDPSMDEMGTVFIRNMGYGSSTKRMTRREAMLNGHMEEQGPALPWKSDKEAENEKRQQEEERKRKADEETKRRQEIIKSTDPSMDEMGTVFIRNMGYGSSTKRMTRREAMLNGHMEEQGPALPWKSDKETENEKRRQEEEQKRNAEEKAKRKQEIMESTDPSMDEMGTLEWNGHPRIDFGGSQHYVVRITKRQKMLIDEGFLDPYQIIKEIKQTELGQDEKNQKTEGIVKPKLQTTEEQSEVVEVKKTANLPKQPKSRISFDSIRQAIKKALGRGER